jgi:hypothetical protein
MTGGRAGLAPVVVLAADREFFACLITAWPATASPLPAYFMTLLGGPTMFARIGVMRALNRNVVREFNPDRKDTHWGGRKLARDRWVPEQINRRRFDFPVRLSWVVSWDKRFDRSVILPGGKTLLMLEDARRHI